MYPLLLGLASDSESWSPAGPAEQGTAVVQAIPWKQLHSSVGFCLEQHKVSLESNLLTL